MNWKVELGTKGYCVIPCLTNSEVDFGKSLFKTWWYSNSIHKQTLTSHGIIKHYEIGHTAFAWWCRTRPKVLEIFKKIWGTDDLIVSYDGSCYFPEGIKRKNTNWLHTDQRPSDSSFKCVQGFICFTANKTSTLMVVPGSHLEHESYMKSKNLKHSKDWQKVDISLERAIHIEANPGDLILWDSRVFHQNFYSPEERLVQYICYLPRSIASKADLKKRQKYYKEKRTTSHWPAPIKVNSLQPQVYGKKDLLIDYTKLINTNQDVLTELQKEIQKLI